MLPDLCGLSTRCPMSAHSPAGRGPAHRRCILPAWNSFQRPPAPVRPRAPCSRAGGSGLRSARCRWRPLSSCSRCSPSAAAASSSPPPRRSSSPSSSCSRCGRPPARGWAAGRLAAVGLSALGAFAALVGRLHAVVGRPRPVVDLVRLRRPVRPGRGGVRAVPAGGVGPPPGGLRVPGGDAAGGGVRVPRQGVARCGYTCASLRPAVGADRLLERPRGAAGDGGAGGARGGGAARPAGRAARRRRERPWPRPVHLLLHVLARRHRGAVRGARRLLRRHAITPEQSPLARDRRPARRPGPLPPAGPEHPLHSHRATTRCAPRRVTPSASGRSSRWPSPSCCSWARACCSAACGRGPGSCACPDGRCWPPWSCSWSSARPST